MNEEHAPRLRQIAPHTVVPVLYVPAPECPCAHEHPERCLIRRNWRTLSMGCERSMQPIRLPTKLAYSKQELTTVA